METPLAKALVTRLAPRFSERGLEIHEGPHPVVTIPAAHPEVGDIAIDDDGDELTLHLGHHTHSHFSPFDYSRPVAEYADALVDQVVEFLDEVLADRIVIWSSTRGGGSYPRGERDPLGFADARHYVWSGPLDPSER